MMRSRNPKPLDQKAFIVASLWAAFLFIVLIFSTFLQSQAAGFSREEDVYTASELCRQACDREYTLCGTGPRIDENYGDNRLAMVQQARCGNDLRDCMRQCGSAPVKNNTNGTSSQPIR